MKNYNFENKEFSRKLMMFLDGELSKQDERAFLAQIQQSPEYLAKLNKEKSFREFIRSKISRRTVSPALVQSIKAKINAPHPGK